MLLTDDDYPQGFGIDSVLYYIVVHPGAQPLWVNGYEEANYVMSRQRITREYISFVIGPRRTRVPISPKLAQEALDVWRQLYAGD